VLSSTGLACSGRRLEGNSLRALVTPFDCAGRAASPPLTDNRRRSGARQGNVAAARRRRRQDLRPSAVASDVDLVAGPPPPFALITMAAASVPLTCTTTGAAAATAAWGTRPKRCRSSWNCPACGTIREECYRYRANRPCDYEHQAAPPAAARAGEGCCFRRRHHRRRPGRAAQPDWLVSGCPPRPPRSRRLFPRPNWRRPPGGIPPGHSR